MSRTKRVGERYSKSLQVMSDGVEVLSVADSPGAQLDNALRRVLASSEHQALYFPDSLNAATRALRWRQMTRPQPLEYNFGLLELADNVLQQLSSLGALEDAHPALIALTMATQQITLTQPVMSPVVADSCYEVGAENCVVVAASKSAATDLQQWLRQKHVAVLTAGELERIDKQWEQAYVIGPPKFYPTSLFMAPKTERISFILPSWFKDKRVPQTALGKYAEGALDIRTKVFPLGHEGSETKSLNVIGDGASNDLDEYRPQPIWVGTGRTTTRRPQKDEIWGRKVLLSDNLAMWLDDGERIRCLDPHQPQGERVAYSDVKSVSVGTYLVLRHGTTERETLYKFALDGLGPDAAQIEATQEIWKARLNSRLQQLGNTHVEEVLRNAGVSAAERVRAWTEPTLIRPNLDQDFQILISWLDLPLQPTLNNALLLRRSRSVANRRITRKLEEALSAADLTRLEQIGHQSLDGREAGTRGMLVTKVKAISPFATVIHRSEVRMPFEDRSGQWLE